MKINNEKGQVLAIVLVFVALMVMSTLYLGNMMRTDVDLVKRMKERDQALYLSEAGINHALAKMKKDGFTARNDFSDSLDTGAYNVSFSTIKGRHLITSLGAVGGNTAEVSVEIKDVMPDALHYVMSAGDDVQVYSSVADAEIDGDMRANDDVKLKNNTASAFVNVSSNEISVVDVVLLGTNYDSTDSKDIHVVINGVAGEPARSLAIVDEEGTTMSFPNFNYQRYREEAVDSGDYYEGDQIFDGVTLTPGNGIVFVDGNVTFNGNCTLYGGIIADDIRVNGTLAQMKSGSRNVIIARNWQINVAGRLYTEEALIHSYDDINSASDNADFEINGVVVCREDILVQGTNTLIDINYAETYPSDMEKEDGEGVLEIVGWNY
jgi:hypothetical protein